MSTANIKTQIAHNSAWLLKLLCTNKTKIAWKLKDPAWHTCEGLSINLRLLCSTLCIFMTLWLPAIYFQVEHVKDAYSLCHYTSNNCWVSHGTSSSQENKNIPFTLKFREEPMLNQNIIDPPQWTISPHCFCCHTSSGPARSSSNYTRMVKRKSWVHLPDSLRPVLSTNSKPQDSHEKKIGAPGFQQDLGMIPYPPAPPKRGQSL